MAFACQPEVGVDLHGPPSTSDPCFGYVSVKLLRDIFVSSSAAVGERLDLAWWQHGTMCLTH